MKRKVNTNILHEAIRQGCKTASDFAYYLKMRSKFLVSVSMPSEHPPYTRSYLG